MSELSKILLTAIVSPLIAGVMSVAVMKAELGALQEDVAAFKDLPVLVATLRQTVARLDDADLVSRQEVARMIEIALIRSGRTWPEQPFPQRSHWTPGLPNKKES